MSFENLVAVSQRHITSLEALAALAARLAAHAEGVRLDPQVEPIVDKIAVAMGFNAADFASTDDAQCRALAGLIRSFFRQATDLVENPGRPPAWAYDDPLVLQSQGRASMALAAIIRQIVGSLGDLESRLKGHDASFLDVGTGVGWLAVAMAQAFPALRVVGIDVWRPALALAASNIAAVANRVMLREQNVVDLRDTNAFDAVFLPGPFLPRSVVPPAVQRAHAALRPGGWLLFGLYAPIDDPLSALVTELRVVRSGGHPWAFNEVASLLQEGGFSDVRSVDRSWQMPMTFVVGCRRARSAE